MTQDFEVISTAYDTDSIVSFHSAKKRAIEDYGNDYNSDTYLRLLHGLLDAAIEYARAKTISPQQFFDDIAAEAVSVINEIAASVTQETSDDVLDKIWVHDSYPYSTFNGKLPFFDRYRFQYSTSDYLSLPYRSRIIDRYLVDCLIAMEMFGFVNEEFGPASRLALKWNPNSKPMHRPHPINSYIKEVFWAFAILGSPIVGLFYLSSQVSVSEWIPGAAIVLIGLLTVYLLLATIRLPFYWRWLRGKQKKILELQDLMVGSYTELRTDGIISAVRVREIAAEAASKGVFWPPELFAVLDDNISRDGKL